MPDLLSNPREIILIIISLLDYDSKLNFSLTSRHARQFTPIIHHFDSKENIENNDLLELSLNQLDTLLKSDDKKRKNTYSSIKNLRVKIAGFPENLNQFPEGQIFVFFHNLELLEIVSVNTPLNFEYLGYHMKKLRIHSTCNYESSETVIFIKLGRKLDEITLCTFGNKNCFIKKLYANYSGIKKLQGNCHIKIQRESDDSIHGTITGYNLVPNQPISI